MSCHIVPLQPSSTQADTCSFIHELLHSPTLTLFYTGRHLLHHSWAATQSHFNPLLHRQTSAPSFLSCHNFPLYPFSAQEENCSINLELPHCPTLTLFYTGRHLLHHSWAATQSHFNPLLHSQAPDLSFLSWVASYSPSWTQFNPLLQKLTPAFCTAIHSQFNPIQHRKKHFLCNFLDWAHFDFSQVVRTFVVPL